MASACRLAAFALVLMLFTACVPVQSQTAAVTSGTSAGTGVAGAVYWIVNGDPEEADLIEALKQVQPGIVVTLEQDSHAGNDFNLDVAPLPSMVTVGTGLDYGKTLDKDGAADLTGIWEKSGLAAALPASLQKLTARAGKQYYVPAVFGWEAIYYNKWAFAKYNLQPPKTWEKFLAVNETLRGHGETPVAIGAEGDSRGYWFQYLALRLYGAQFYHDLLNGHIPFSDPRARKVMATWQGLFQRGDLRALPQGNDQDMMLALVRGDKDTTAQAGGGLKAVMALTDGHVASQLAPELFDELGYFRFPIMDPALPVTEATYSYGYAAPAGQPLTPATEALLTFTGSAAGQAVIAHAHNDWASGRGDIAVQEDTAQQQAVELFQQADNAVQDFYGLMPGQMIGMFDDTLTRFINAPQEIDGPLNELETARQIMLNKGAFADSTIESNAAATQTASTLVAQLLLAGPADASSPVSDALVFQVDASDPAVAGTFPGHQEVDGIDHVDFDLFGPDGRQLYHHLERWAPYCGFDDGDPCNVYDFAEHNYQWPKGQAIVNGPLRLLATIYVRDGRVKTVDTTVMVEKLRGQNSQTENPPAQNPPAQSATQFEGLSTGLDNATQARIRAVSALAGGPNVDVYINSLPATNGGKPQQNMPTGEFSGWLYVPPGSYSVALVPHGGMLNQELFAPQMVQAEAGHRYSVAAMGNLKDNSVRPLVVDETALEGAVGLKPTSDVYITINNLEGTTGLDIRHDGKLLATTNYSEASVMICPSNDRQFEQITAAGKPDTVIASAEMWCHLDAGSAAVWYGDYPDNVISSSDSIFTSETNNVLDFLAEYNSHHVVDDNEQVLSFNTLLSVIDKAGMRGQFSGRDPYFLLAPTDAAFDQLPKEQLDALLSDPQTAAKLVKTHLVLGYYPYGSLSGGMYGQANAEVTNLLGQRLRLLGSNINGENIHGPNFTVGNGNRVQLIDKLLPVTP